MGIEPTPSAWEAEVLPLNYTRTATAQRINNAHNDAFIAIMQYNVAIT